MKTTARIRELKEPPLTTGQRDFVWAKIYVADILFSDESNRSGHLLCRLEGLEWRIGDVLEITIEKK